MRQHHRPGTAEAITDVKSRIVFETPENTERAGIARNRSFSGYKLDVALLQSTGQARHIPPQNLYIPQPKHDRVERNTNLTVQGIKKKYGFTSTKAPSASGALRNISNGEKPSVESYKPTVSDVKSKYESKKQGTYTGLANYQRENQNESLVLEKYRVEKSRPTFKEPERELLRQTHRFSSVAHPPPHIASDLTHKRLPSACNEESTPNFSDQIKDRNHDWLSNLNRVQDRIRAALQR